MGVLSATVTKPKIVAKPGEAPPFWPDRNAIFFPNLLAMFFDNATEVRALSRTLGGVVSHGARIAPILNILFKGNHGSNALVLEQEPDLGLFQYFEEELGLPLPEYRVLPHREYLQLDRGPQWLDWLAHTGADWIDGYVTDRALETVSHLVHKRTVSTFTGSWRGNNKVRLHEFLKRSGLPVFDTLLVESNDELASSLRKLSTQGYTNAVIKAPFGASGVGLEKMATSLTLSRRPWVPSYFFFEGPCLVQGWLDEGVYDVTNVRSPSVQMFLDEDQVHLFEITEQILGSTSIHKGNEAPAPNLSPDLERELLRQAGIAGQWLHAQGYRGTAGTDFVVVDRAETTEVRISEINARVTGATYPAILAQHFQPGGAWVMQNVTFLHEITSESLLQKLARNGHLYRPGMEGGVLPYNLYTCPEFNHLEKGQLLSLAADVPSAHALLHQAEQELPIDWEYGSDR